MRAAMLLAVVLSAATASAQGFAKDAREQADESQRATMLRPYVVFAGSSSAQSAEFAGEVERLALDGVRDAGFPGHVQTTAKGGEAELARALRDQVMRSLEQAEVAGTADGRAQEIQRVYRLGKERQRTKALDDEVIGATFFWRLHVTRASCRSRTSSELCHAALHVDVFRLSTKNARGYEKAASFGVGESGMTRDDGHGADKALRLLRRSFRKAFHSVPGLALTAPVQVAAGGDVVINGLGDEQGVALDTVFTLWNQRFDGSFQRAGVAKVRQVGRRGEPSRAALVSVDEGFSLRGGELAREHPMRGVSFWLSGGAFSGALSGQPVVSSASASAGVALSLAQATGWSEFSSELEVDGAFALAGSAPAPLLAHLGLRKKFQVRRFSLGIGVAASGGVNLDVGGRTDLSAEVHVEPWLSVGAKGGILALVQLSDTSTSLSPFARGFVSLHF